MSDKNRPKIKKGQFYVCFSDTDCGVALALDGKWFCKDKPKERFAIYKSFDEALEFATDMNNKNPMMLGQIYDHLGNLMQYVSNESRSLKVKKDKFTALACEVQTGIILTLEGDRFREDQPKESCLFFDSLDEAKSFCEQKVNANPEIEYGIYNSSKECVSTVRSETFPEEPKPKAKRKRFLGIF